jgi:integral membrane protein (TIGR01906 family)
MQSLRGLLAGLAIGIPTAVVIVAVAIVAFLNPVWVAFEQGRAQSATWTGFSPADLRTATDSILSDLVLGPPRFDVALDGVPVLNERERSHMGDVRSVFTALYLVAAASGVLLVAAFVVTRGTGSGRAGLWRRLSRSGLAIAVVTVVGGLLGLAFFDAAFEAFHEAFFPPGTFLFDPRTDRLVQLFPDAFWSETTVAVGILIVALSLGVWWLGRRKAAA